MNIETKTINDLRTLSTTPNPGTFYYITDLGKEGEWYYAGKTTTFTDNLGTELNSGWVGTTPPSPSISSPVNIFKRVYDPGFVTATWFFDNSEPDDTLGIQRALDFISPTIPPINYNDSTGGTIFLPKGIYNISKTLLIGQNCRLIGVNNRYHYLYEKFNEGGGTVIRANFSPENKNNWVISSATFVLSAPSPFELLPYDIVLNYDKNNSDYYFEKAAYTMGINIENLTIDGGDKAFGGIRLSNSANSTIRNVGVHNLKCGFLVNTCWGGSIENCFANFDWYGALVIYCNSFLVINSYFRGSYRSDHQIPPYVAEIPQTELPNFIYQDSYAALGLDDKVKLGKTGIYCFGSAAVSINTVVVEYTTNGITSLISTTNFISQYIEGIVYYGLTVGVAHVEMDPPQPPLEELVTEVLVNQITITGNLGSFYFGNGVMAKIDSVSCSNSQLYVYNNAERRNILFTNTFIQHGSRKYFPDILFIDEGEYGQNFGSVYVDPTNGNDDNYGFNKNDAVKTFDAALIRVQNQSTINPVETIYIKAAPLIHEGSPSLFAALKNLEIISIENANILITPYDTDDQHLRGMIYFEGDANETKLAMIGQIELLGNVNLYFRNIDLITNDAQLMSANPVNLSMFGLTNSYSKVTFEVSNKGSLPQPFQDINIYINFCYFLFQANNLSINTTRNDSLLDVKFVNILLSSNSSFAITLSPDIPFAPAILGVDCVQISSTLPIANYSLPNRGWNNSIIIRNNF